MQRNRYVAPHLRDEEDDQSERRQLLAASTFPACSVLRKGPINGSCVCREDLDKHISYFDANMGAKYHGVCGNRGTLFQPLLPRWATGTPNRMAFLDIPTVGILMNVFERSTFWWRRFHSGKSSNKRWLSMQARKLLFCASGLELNQMKNIPTSKLVEMKERDLAYVRFETYC
jgi:hypothetical protein